VAFYRTNVANQRITVDDAKNKTLNRKPIPIYPEKISPD
jgi:hypothetical protein